METPGQGKLALLDRLIMRLRTEGSRILLFSQYQLRSTSVRIRRLG